MEKQLSDEQLEWKTGETRTLLQTPIAQICESQAKAFDGQEHKYITINSHDWVTVIPVINSKFIMVKQWRHGEKALSIEFPGGVIDDGESPLEGAIRELREETGYSAEKMYYLGKINPNPAFMTNHFHVFAAFDLKHTDEQKLDNDEYLNYLELEQSEVFAKMGTEEMPHALMAAALLMYRQHEESGTF